MGGAQAAPIAVCGLARSVEHVMPTTAMAQTLPPESAGQASAPRRHGLSRKAFVFALIGVLNTAVDYAVFLAARAALMHWPSALAAFAWLADCSASSRADRIASSRCAIVRRMGRNSNRSSTTVSTSRKKMTQRTDRFGIT